MSTIHVLAIGTFPQAELVTRVLRQTFHVELDHDTDISDGLVSRVMEINLNGRPLDDSKLWEELVNTLKQRLADEHQAEIERERARTAAWQASYHNLIDQLYELVARLEDKTE
jgi:hypothetical protein